MSGKPWINKTLTPGRDEYMYCPYCNRHDVRKKSDEHVIPRLIGGDEHTVIRVCKPCNDLAGSTIDTLLGKNARIRLSAISSGMHFSRWERHESTAILNDGRRLTGRFYTEGAGTGKYKICFEPDSLQEDGSKWVSAAAVSNAAKLPPHVNIYSPDMLDRASVGVADPRPMEPAFAKILLGILYLAFGRQLVVRSTFDPLREAIKGVVPDRVKVRWMDRGELSESLAGTCEVPNTGHFIWCWTKGSKYVGGVSLFASVTAELTLPDSTVEHDLFTMWKTPAV